MSLHRPAALVLVLFLACEMPRDPGGTLERVRAGVLRVGALDAPPLLERVNGDGAGPEADLARDLAESLGARVEWHWGSVDEHMEALESLELDLVVGGLTTDSPWGGRVAFSRPWRIEDDVRRVLAVGPGENAMLVAVERFIHARNRMAP